MSIGFLEKGEKKDEKEVKNKKMCEFCRRRHCPSNCPSYESGRKNRKQKRQESSEGLEMPSAWLWDNIGLENRMKTECQYEQLGRDDV